MSAKGHVIAPLGPANWRLKRAQNVVTEPKNIFFRQPGEPIIHETVCAPKEVHQIAQDPFLFRNVVSHKWKIKILTFE